jgi:hypothetical protein
MACENGMAALGETDGDGFRTILRSMENPICKAMHAWIEDSAAFDIATTLQKENHWRRWHRRLDLPRVAPQTTKNVLLHLGKAISDLLRNERRDCRCCTVEHVRQADGSDYFVAYPDGVWQTTLVHDANDNLVVQSLRSAFEIVFAYDRNEGVLETCANLPLRIELQLERAFCGIVLDAELSTTPRRPAFNLNVLKDGPALLATEPTDGVEAGVRRMRLAILNSRRSIILVADRNGDREDIYAMLRECLNRQRLLLSVLDITAAQFYFEFRAVNGRPPKTITVDILYPDLCTVRNHRPDDANVVRKCLHKWRIAVA